MDCPSSTGCVLEDSVYRVRETRRFLSQEQVRGHHVLCYRVLCVHTYLGSVARTAKAQTLTPAFPQPLSFLSEVLWEVSSVWTGVDAAEEDRPAYCGTSPR